jgi:hypothetical protein
MVKVFDEAEFCFPGIPEALEFFFAGGILKVTVGAEKPKL